HGVDVVHRAHALAARQLVQRQLVVQTLVPVLGVVRGHGHLRSVLCHCCTSWVWSGSFLASGPTRWATPRPTCSGMPPRVSGEANRLARSRTSSSNRGRRPRCRDRCQTFLAELDIPVIVGGCADYQTALHLTRTGAAGIIVGYGANAGATTPDVLRHRRADGHRDHRPPTCPARCAARWPSAATPPSRSS